MKKHLSTFMLMARFALWPTLAVALLGAAVSAALLFSSGTQSSWDSSNYFGKINYVVLGAVIVLFVLFLRPMRERGGVQPGYTLRRLGVSELTAYIWQFLAAAMGFFICLMSQAAVIFAFALYTQAQRQGPAGDMSALVMLYLSPVAHALMPLSDWPVYIRMAAGLLCAGRGGVLFPLHEPTRQDGLLALRHPRRRHLRRSAESGYRRIHHGVCDRRHIVHCHRPLPLCRALPRRGHRR